MRFKDYITELHNIEAGQAMHAHEPPTNNGISLDNPKIRAEINHRLKLAISEKTYDVSSVLQNIRKVLHRYFIDLPAGFELDPDGDELFFEVEQFGNSYDSSKELMYLYILYYLDDHGYYDFDVELVTEQGLIEILDTTGVTNFDPEDEEEYNEEDDDEDEDEDEEKDR